MAKHFVFRVCENATRFGLVRVEMLVSVYRWAGIFVGGGKEDT